MRSGGRRKPQRPHSRRPLVLSPSRMKGRHQSPNSPPPLPPLTNASTNNNCLPSIGQDSAGNVSLVSVPFPDR